MTEISVTLKANAGYDAPWIVVKAETPDELSNVLAELRDKGAFVAVKTLAAEFTEAAAVPSGDPLDVIKQTLGGQVVHDSQDHSVAKAAAGVEQSTPPCKHCGKPTTFREGNHPQSGAWSGYFCTSGDRTHTEFLK